MRTNVSAECEPLVISSEFWRLKYSSNPYKCSFHAEEFFAPLCCRLPAPNNVLRACAFQRLFPTCLFLKTMYHFYIHTVLFSDIRPSLLRALLKAGVCIKLAFQLIFGCVRRTLPSSFSH